VIGAVAGKELLALSRDRRLVVTSACVLALLAVAALAGWAAQRQAAREVAAARAADREAWLDQGPRNPHSAAHFGQYAFKPTPALAFFDRGVDAQAGIAVWMEAHYQDPASFRAAEERTALARMSELTAAGVLQLLLPLLITLLAFDAVVGERERGTWKLQVAQGVPVRRLVLGKLAGLGAALALPLGLAVLAGAAALAAAGGADGALPRIALLAVVYALYFTACLCLALAVSAWSRSSRLALLLLFGAWIANGLVVPRLAADLSERLHPAPAASEFWDQVRRDMAEGIDGHDPADSRRRALEEETLARYGAATLEELPVNFEALALQAGEEYGNRVFDRRWGELWRAYERQETVQAAAAALAPLLAVRGLSMGLTGTDLARHRHFAAAAEAHRRVINSRLNEHMARHAGREGFEWRADATFWSEVPEFTYAPPGLGAALAAHRLELLLLLGWTGGALLLALVAARRAAVV
jgi:ABC-2 type transport system permease protein